MTTTMLLTVLETALLIISYVLEGVDDDDDVDIFYGVGDELA